MGLFLDSPPGRLQWLWRFSGVYAFVFRACKLGLCTKWSKHLALETSDRNMYNFIEHEHATGFIEHITSFWHLAGPGKQPGDWIDVIGWSFCGRCVFSGATWGWKWGVCFSILPIFFKKIVAKMVISDEAMKLGVRYFQIDPHVSWKFIGGFSSPLWEEVTIGGYQLPWNFWVLVEKQFDL
jgi:hypothetical protein